LCLSPGSFTNTLTMRAYKFRSSTQIARAFDIIFNSRLYCADWTTFNDPREGFFESSPSDNRKTEAIRSAKRRFKICCLSKSFSSRLLWAHYASGYDGLAIEVDLPAQTAYGPICNVTYENVLPNADLQLGDVDAVALSFLRRKDRDWRYEDEVRIIQGEVWFPLDNPVQRIIVGHRFNESLLNALHLVCLDRQIELMRTSIQNYKVTAIPI
jgi:hypothetical protein